jgi:hypothetical protein
LYRPVRLITWPPMMLEAIMTIIIGIRTVPLWVALVPMTPWMNSGMNRIVPNMPTAISVRASTEVVTTLFLNSVSGMIGSAARLSTTMNTASMAAARPNKPRMTGEVQA